MYDFFYSIFCSSHVRDDKSNIVRAEHLAHSRDAEAAGGRKDCSGYRLALISAARAPRRFTVLLSLRAATPPNVGDIAPAALGKSRRLRGGFFSFATNVASIIYGIR